MRVVICGGGVIGACIAYFLSLRQVEVDRGRAHRRRLRRLGQVGRLPGARLVRRHRPGRLARRSFALHAELAAELDGSRWGYRRLDTWSVLVGAERGRAGRRWLAWRQSARIRASSAAPDTTAQVHPARFTEAMMQAAIDQGARVAARARDRCRPRSRRARRRGRRGGWDAVAADAVVIAMGPWSSSACRWLPLPAVFGLKGNSVVFQSSEAISADALFVELAAADGAMQTPEVFPRADGTTYVCGLSSQQALPDDPAEVMPDPGAQEALRAMTRAFAPALAAAPIIGDPGLLPAGHAGWSAAARPGGRRRQGVRRHGAQRLGHPQCTRERRGVGGTDRGGRRRGMWTCAASIRPGSRRDSGRPVQAEGAGTSP